MNRLPRRTTRVKPPLRGRAATQHYRGQYAPLSIARPAVKPPSKPSPPLRRKIVSPQPLHKEHKSVDQHQETGLFTELLSFYKSWGRLIRSMDQSWQWLLVLGIVLLSVLILPRLL